MDWVKDEKYQNVYYKINKINNTIYKVQFAVTYTGKSIRAWVFTSSGTKRKHLESFEENDYKRDGGIRALMWVKEQLNSIYPYLNEKYNIEDLNKYICIEWADTKRKNIYSRLQKEGYYFNTQPGGLLLMKKIK